MTNLPHQRREYILARLEEVQTLSIEELVTQLNVSNMTIHRDLDVLVQDGLVEKIHGGVTLPKLATAKQVQTCQLCHATLNTRTTFLIQPLEGEVIRACCPHCGFLLLKDYPTIRSALTPDFLYGRMINASQAIYVVNSEVALCCSPNILCFERRSDAERFQLGFGGEVLTFPQAYDLMVKDHHHHAGHN